MNQFLASINNELATNLNSTYAHNIESLNKFVLVLFSEDQTVVPKESSWFGSFASAEEDNAYIPMRMQPIYLDDRIGLRTLDERGAIVEWVCKGEHMQLDVHCWKPLIRRWTGGEMSSGSDSNGRSVHGGLVVQDGIV